MTATQISTGTYTIDAAHSQLGFSVRHAGVSRVRGRMTGFEGSFTVTEPISDAIVRATIDAATVDTGNAQRDQHLISADFWDASENGEWSFKSTSVSGTPENLTIEGELTINGVAKQVSLDAELDGYGPGPQGETRAAYVAKTTISRKEFNLSWNVALEGGGVLVGDKVSIELEIVGVLEN